MLLGDCEVPLWIQALTPTNNFSKAREDNIFCQVSGGSQSFVDDAPYAEYEVALHPGINDIEIRTLPTLHVYEGRDARFAVKIDDSEALIFNIHTDDFSAPWRWNVLRGYASEAIQINLAENTTKRVRIYFLDPGIVLQEILCFSSP